MLNRYEIAWCLCTASMLITGCAPFKEFVNDPETQDAAISIVTDAATGNWPGAAIKAGGLAVACLLAVLGVKKIRAARSAT